jgi:regulator of sigma E protease
MKVEEFSIGFFNPVLYSKKIGDTVYSIRAMLFGGYVKILGENSGEGSEITDKRAFSNRPWWQQAVVLVAGVAMNLALAYVLFVVTSYGLTTVTVDNEDFKGRIINERMAIADVMPNSPASSVGIHPGAVLLEVKSYGQKSSLKSEEDVVTFLSKHENDPIQVTYQNRGSEISSTTLALVYGLIPDKKALGLALQRVGDVHIGFFESFKVGGQQLSQYTILTVEGLYNLVAKAFQGDNVLNSLSGPVGIAKLVGQASDIGYQSVLLLVAFLSLNLAILNILPLPALDGGQLVKITIEAVLRRKLRDSHSQWLNAIGFILLMALLITVTIHDVMKLFQ